jgi:hypothetical protein
MPQTSAITTQYLCNPDVVLREEDEDGGLLFNPDTNQVKVVNSTGLFIWKMFVQVNNFSAVKEAILQTFEDVPENEVTMDLQDYLDEMVRSGFIGAVEAD